MSLDILVSNHTSKLACDICGKSINNETSLWIENSTRRERNVILSHTECFFKKLGKALAMKGE